MFREELVKKAKPWCGLMIAVALSACDGAGNDPSVAGVNVAVDATEAPSIELAARHPGEMIYQNYCFSCHTPGLSGAPKLGDAEAWRARIAKGQTLLLQSTIAGIQPAMPPRGMCFDCSDEELAAAVDYLIANSQ